MNWHLSDHTPIAVSIKANEAINAIGILRRARDLNEFDPNTTIIKRYNQVYNYDIMVEYVLQYGDNNGIQRTIIALDTHIANAHKSSKCPKPQILTIDRASKLMDDANKA